MIPDFKVVVQRYWCNEIGCSSYDGFFISKVYAIDGNEFLVYDDGDYSSEPDIPGGFTWVDFTETVPDINNEERVILKVQLYEEAEE